MHTAATADFIKTVPGEELSFPASGDAIDLITENSVTMTRIVIEILCKSTVNSSPFVIPDKILINEFNPVKDVNCASINVLKRNMTLPHKVPKISVPISIVTPVWIR